MHHSLAYAAQLRAHLECLLAAPLPRDDPAGRREVPVGDEGCRCRQQQQDDDEAGRKAE